MPTSNPAVLSSLTPAANIGGSSVAVPPLPMSMGNQAIGGNTNPFLPAPTTGQSATPLSAPSTTTPTAPAPTPSPTDPAGLGGTNLYNLWGGGQNKAGIIKGLEKTGIPGGLAALLAEFLMSGAGFNPQVAQNLIAAMQPQIERGRENIAEQFSVLGNRFGSPAATGFADYESQVNLNIGEIFSQLYEQSVSNYLSILMGAGKKTPTFGSTFGQAFAGGLGGAAGSAVSALALGA